LRYYGAYNKQVMIFGGIYGQSYEKKQG